MKPMIITEAGRATLQSGLFTALALFTVVMAILTGTQLHDLREERDQWKKKAEEAAICPTADTICPAWWFGSPSGSKHHAKSRARLCK